MNSTKIEKTKIQNIFCLISKMCRIFYDEKNQRYQFRKFSKKEFKTKNKMNMLLKLERHVPSKWLKYAFIRFMGQMCEICSNKSGSFCWEFYETCRLFCFMHVANLILHREKFQGNPARTSTCVRINVCMYLDFRYVYTRCTLCVSTFTLYRDIGTYLYIGTHLYSRVYMKIDLLYSIFLDL